MKAKGSYEILLVDDDPIILKTLSSALENQGYKITLAKSGESAIEKLTGHHFDILITDMYMNHVHGLDVFKKAKKVYPDIMAIIITGIADIKTAIDALRLSADDYLLKPFETEEILFRVGRCVEKIKCRKKVRQAEKLLMENKLKYKNMESIATMSGGLAHDFNNLLTSILGNIDLTQMNTPMENESKNWLAEAKNACIHAKELTHQLIIFADGGAPVKHIGSIADLLKKSSLFSLSGSNVDCHFNIPENLWHVEYDESQLKHVINNLITNADHAMPDGGTINVEAKNIIIDSKDNNSRLQLQPGKYIRISIRDHGIGILKEHLTKIFDPYFSTKERGIKKGMGLGLATSYSIIAKHNGQITVDTTIDKGTTFSFYIPASDKKVSGAKPKKKPEQDKLKNYIGKILVMDDEQMIRDLIKQMLDRFGYHSEFAKNGAEAIQVYKKAINSGKHFDVVILDLTVKGGMGGKTAVKKLLEIDPSVQAIVSSGYSNDPIVTDFKKYGFVGALAKPYTMKELKTTLTEIINHDA